MSAAIEVLKKVGAAIANNPGKTALAVGAAGLAASVDTSGAEVTPVGGGKVRVTTKNNGIIKAMQDFGDGAQGEDGRTTFTLSAAQYERAKPFLSKVTEPAKPATEPAPAA